MKRSFDVKAEGGDCFRRREATLASTETASRAPHALADMEMKVLNKFGLSFCLHEERAEITSKLWALSALGAPDELRHAFERFSGFLRDHLRLQNDIKGSPLPEIWEKFGEDPDRFIQYTWIRLVADPFTAGIVTNIEILELELRGDSVYVATHGEWDVILEGLCPLNRRAPPVAPDSP